MKLDPKVEKVIGIFAAKHTFNDASEEKLLKSGTPWFDPEAPTIGEMTAKAIEILSQDPDQPFFLVSEEEATDNFSNKMNAGGMIEAVRRSDRAIGAALGFMEANPERKVLLLLAADSDAGNPSVWAPRDLPADTLVQKTTKSGAAIDGVDGADSLPYVSVPDANGKAHAFGIVWPFHFDSQGSVVAKAHGYASDRLPVDLDNTGIYTLIRSVLFGE